MLLVLFGLSGSGKNYVGRILRDDYRMFFYDADDDLLPEMRDAIRKQAIIPDHLRDTFFDNMVERIKLLRKQEGRLAVSQAIYKEKHRELILRNFPDAQFIWVQTSPEVIAGRLSRRTDNPSTLAYAQKILAIFEAPKIKHFVLKNDDGREAAKRQVGHILAQIPH